MQLYTAFWDILNVWNTDTIVMFPRKNYFQLLFCSWWVIITKMSKNEKEIGV